MSCSVLQHRCNSIPDHLIKPFTPGDQMNDVVTALCRQLYTLARREEEAAAHEAARTPQWGPTPASVEVHRIAARLLRADADRLEFESRPWGVPI